MTIISMIQESIMTENVFSGRIGTRKEQKAQTRRLILEAAIIEFGKSGFEKTAISEIAKRADVSYGNVFAHFATKEELFTRAIEEFGQRMASRLNELSQVGVGLHCVLSTHLKVIAEFEDLYSQTVAKSSMLPEFAQTAIVGVQSAISHQISLAAKTDMEKGKMKNVPIHMLFNAWTALVGYYLTNRQFFSPNGSVIELKGNEILDFFMLMLEK